MRLKIITFSILVFLSSSSETTILASSGHPEGSLSKVFQAVNPSVVLIISVQHPEIEGNLKDMASVGSGVIISKKGEIMTAAHTVNVSDKIVIQFLSGQTANASVVASSSEADIALLQLETVPEDIQVARLGNSDKVQVGDQVMVIGAPYGIDHTLTVGHMSGRRKSRTVCQQLTPFEFIQTDAAINQGNSGGPMFDVDGNVIGIVSRILSRSGGSMGLGFAVSINTAKDLLLDQKAFWIGFDAYLLSGALAKAFNLPQEAGLLIQNVADNSPGDRLGLKAGSIPVQVGNEKFLIGGDIVLTIQGFQVTHSIDDACAIQDVIGGFTSETDIELKVLRDGKVIYLSNKK